MSVACAGEARVIEQLGEKQDFEAELSRRGFPHEDFSLHVEIAKGTDSRVSWDQRYEVAVIHRRSQSIRIYRGGPRKNWVRGFTQDLLDGVYGEPTLWRSPAAADGPTRGRRSA